MPKKTAEKDVLIGDCLTITEAARIAKVVEGTIRAAIGRGDISTAETRGGTRHVVGESLDHWVKNRPKIGRPKVTADD